MLYSVRKTGTSALAVVADSHDYRFAEKTPNCDTFANAAESLTVSQFGYQ